MKNKTGFCTKIRKNSFFVFQKCVVEFEAQKSWNSLLVLCISSTNLGRGGREVIRRGSLEVQKNHKPCITLALF